MPFSVRSWTESFCSASQARALSSPWLRASTDSSTERELSSLWSRKTLMAAATSPRCSAMRASAGNSDSDPRAGWLQQTVDPTPVGDRATQCVAPRKERFSAEYLTKAQRNRPPISLSPDCKFRQVSRARERASVASAIEPSVEVAIQRLGAAPPHCIERFCLRICAHGSGRQLNVISSQAL